jgi:hypothetical protein
MQVAGWTLTKEEQLVKLNLGTIERPQCVKINAQLTTQTCSLKILLQEGENTLHCHKFLSQCDFCKILKILIDHVIK